MSTRFRFSKTALINLPSAPDKKRVTYYDELVRKLAIRVTSSGAKTFYLVTKHQGETTWMKLGSFPDMTVERAREAAQKMLGEFTPDSTPAQVRRARRAEMTLAEFFDEEYAPRHAKKLRSWSNIEALDRLYIRPALGRRKLSQVDRQSIMRLIADREQQGWAGSSINRLRNQISGMFRLAIEWGFVEHNPVTPIRMRKETRRSRFLLAPELPRFFAALAGEESQDIRDYILISLLTGARKSNVVSMRWADLRFDEGVWMVPAADSKNGIEMTVVLVPEVIELLRARKNDTPWVFPSRGETGHLVTPRKGWLRLLDRDELMQLQGRIRDEGVEFEWPARLIKPKGNKGRKLESLDESLDRARSVAKTMGIDTTGCRLADLRIHDLRRTLGSWQAKTGASLVLIGKSLGHQSVQTTSIYARLDVDPVRTAVSNATSAMLEAALNERKA